MSKTILEIGQFQHQLHSFYTDIQLVDTTGSTNDDLKKIASEANEGTVIIAKEQTAGKGQKGRSFISNKNQGIYVSILLKPTFHLKHSSLLPLLTANAVIEAIKTGCKIDAKSKWVNDVMINERKVAGILCESSFTENHTLDWMVVGIGLNVYKQDFPDDISTIATTLEEHAPFVSISDILVSLLNEFALRITSFEPAKVLEEYRSNCLHLNKTIGVISQGKVFEATCLDVDDEGCLVVSTDLHTHLHLSSVEVMLIKGDHS